jgi:hypothetical protein
MQRSKYTAEFKSEAVKQVVDKGHTVVDVASRLGLGEGVLYNWVHNCFTLVFFKLFANNLGCYHYYPGVNHVRRHPFQN